VCSGLFFARQLSADQRKTGHTPVKSRNEILCETARLMRSLPRDHGVVARIGGDEFGVVFWDAGEPRAQEDANGSGH